MTEHVPGRTLWPVLVAALVAGAGAVGALVLFMSTTEPQTVARRDLTLVDGRVDAVEVSVQCGLVSTSGDDEWGTAAGVACAGPTMSHLAVAGALATVGGALGIVFASDRWLRWWGDPQAGTHVTLRRSARLFSTVVLVGGLSATSLGIGLLTFGDEVSRLTVDERDLLEVVAPEGDLLTSFQVVGLSASGGGRYEEEVWAVVATPAAGGEAIDDVRQALVVAGWEPGEVTEEFTDGWVALRGSAGSPSDLVEVGLAREALGEEADLSSNARRLLASALPDDPRAVAVRLAPSLLSG